MDGPQKNRLAAFPPTPPTTSHHDHHDHDHDHHQVLLTPAAFWMAEMKNSRPMRNYGQRTSRGTFGASYGIRVAPPFATRTSPMTTARWKNWPQQMRIWFSRFVSRIAICECAILHQAMALGTGWLADHWGGRKCGFRMDPSIHPSNHRSIHPLIYRSIDPSIPPSIH